MLKRTVLTMMFLFSSVVYADSLQGKQLFDEGNCIDCHNVEKMKPREHKINNFIKLHEIVDACAQNSGVGWFDKETMDVSTYLNHQYYRFKIKKR